MQLERLQLDLRPRPRAQALDLGLALLRAHAADTWRAWLALWLPVAALMMAATWYWPLYSMWFMTLAWWVRPLLERAPLYVLSREVFGEHVGWRTALRAWPRALRGGWFRLLTWWRPFMSGRGLYQPVWQLERASGATAGQRLRVLGRQGTGFAAWAFGIACSAFEFVLVFGVIGLLALFVSSEHTANPFALFVPSSTLTGDAREAFLALTMGAAYAVAVAIIGPVYVACTFALYLNRRANLEAWDIELTLRQIRPPHVPQVARATAGTLLAAVLCVAALWLPAPPAEAAEDTLVCDPPKVFVTATQPARSPDQDEAQRRVRAEVDALYATEDLRGYKCESVWRLRDRAKPEKKKPDVPLKLPEWLALVVEAALIGTAVLLVGWFVWRYRDRLTWSSEGGGAAPATEVAGLDITEASLPDDVAGHARAMWARSERRAALALLYRATLSRLVYQHGLDVPAGATEGDCLRAARAAHAAQRLDDAALGVTTGLTSLWLAAAYADRWPDSAAFEAQCAAWASVFAELRA